MSKIRSAFMIIILLCKTNKMTCRELASSIGISQRMVKNYIIDLEECGIHIDTIYGRYGGYTLNKSNCKFIDYFTKNHKK